MAAASAEMHRSSWVPDLTTYKGAKEFVGMLGDPASHGVLESELLGGQHIEEIDDGLAIWANLVGGIASDFAEHGYGTPACALIEYLFRYDPPDAVIYKYINNSKSWWRTFLIRVDAASRLEPRRKGLWEYIRWETNK